MVSKFILYQTPSNDMRSRWSVQNRLDGRFHLIDEVEMPENCFYAEKEFNPSGFLNTVFQVWEKDPIEKR